MKYFSILLISISLSGCFNGKISTKELIGDYSSGMPQLWSSKLLLSKDKTFLFEHTGEGSSIGYLEGNWRRRKNLVYLFYNLTPKSEELSQAYETVVNGDSTTIFVRSYNLEPSFAAVFYKSNGSTKIANTNSEGKVTFSKEEIDSITIRGTGFSNYKYKVINSKSNFFEICIEDERRYFNALVQKNGQDQTDTLEIFKDRLCPIKGINHLTDTSNWSCLKRNQIELR